MASAAPPRPRMRLIPWGVSLVGGGLLLWVASTRLELIPTSLRILHWQWLAAAVALQIPYALTRALRLRYVLDPLVVSATNGRRRRFDGRVLYGSGFVAFFVLLLLPLRLGELSRPILVGRAAEPGVGLTEAVGAVAIERVVDGLLICAMLLGGLAFAELHADVVAAGWVRDAALGLLVVFLGAVGVLAWLARDPPAWGARLRRLGLGARVAVIVERFAGAMQGLLALGGAVRFVVWSVAYWSLTVAQLWMVARASGLPLGAAEAASVVAVVGLSIQLPGGPAQAGTFQFGVALALPLFVGAALMDAAATFAALMYLLQVVGALAMALPGLVLLGMAGRTPPPEA